MKRAPSTGRQPRRKTLSRKLRTKRRWRGSDDGSKLGVRDLALKSDNYLCQSCLKDGITTPANEVDHIIPTRLRPDLFYTLDNLQTLCGPCHSKKTDSGG